jgi:hypothetical protein
MINDVVMNIRDTAARLPPIAVIGLDKTLKAENSEILSRAVDLKEGWGEAKQEQQAGEGWLKNQRAEAQLRSIR